MCRPAALAPVGLPPRRQDLHGGHAPVQLHLARRGGRAADRARQPDRRLQRVVRGVVGRYPRPALRYGRQVCTKAVLLCTCARPLSAPSYGRSRSSSCGSGSGSSPSSATASERGATASRNPLRSSAPVTVRNRGSPPGAAIERLEWPFRKPATAIDAEPNRLSGGGGGVRFGGRGESDAWLTARWSAR